MKIRFDDTDLRFPSVYREVAYPGLIRAALKLAVVLRHIRPAVRHARLFGGAPAGAA